MPPKSLAALEPLTIGWIPYWNLEPMRAELKRNAGSALNFRTGHPTEINRLLNAQKVHVAPSSSVCLLTEALHEMAFPLGVACSGAVQSVYLGLSGDISHLSELVKTRVTLMKEIVQHARFKYPESARHAADFVWQECAELDSTCDGFVPRLKLTSHSASSCVLAKIIYRMLFGKSALDSYSAYMPTSSGLGTLELIIGDDALMRRDEFSRVIDLGQLWKSVTGLPFVYAVWQKSGGNLSSAWREAIRESAEIAEAHMHVEPADYIPSSTPLMHSGRDIDLSSYWKSLRYRLTNRDLHGLMLFLCLARPIVKADIDDHVIIKMRRWQEMGVTASL